MTDSGRLSAQDRQLAVLIASGATYKEAATHIGLSERTVRRHAKGQAFQSEVETLRAQLAERALGQALAAVSVAVSTLTSLLHSDSEAMQLRAATAVIEKALQLRQHDSLERRLAAIEQAQDESPAGGWQL